MRVPCPRRFCNGRYPGLAIAGGCAAVGTVDTIWNVWTDVSDRIDADLDQDFKDQYVRKHVADLSEKLHSDEAEECRDKKNNCD